MNSALVAQFEILRNYYKKKGDIGRSLAYGKVVSILRMFPQPIDNVKQLQGIPGLGTASLDKIREYLVNGFIETVEEIKSESQHPLTKEKEILNGLEKIWGVGPVKALVLYKSGIRSIEDLRKRQELLTSAQRIGLKYYDDLQKKVKRETITAIWVIIELFLREKWNKKDFQVIVAGSYRRKMRESGDIDIIITSSKFSLKDIVTVLIEKNVITDVLALRSQKCMSVAKCPGHNSGFFRMDIEFCPKNELGSALLYFTGSANFNIYIRNIAKKMGLVLNEHGLFSLETGELVLQSPEEKDIFARLGLAYIPPERR